MILFELRCANDHHFEGWFKDNAAFDSQAAANEIACPHCGNTQVAKAIMAPRISKATGQSLDAVELAGEVRRALTELRQHVETQCDYVGGGFAEEARKIHYGEAESRPIYGEASPDQARELQEEGVAIQQIPWLPREN